MAIAHLLPASDASGSNYTGVIPVGARPIDNEPDDSAPPPTEAPVNGHRTKVGKTTQAAFYDEQAEYRLCAELAYQTHAIPEALDIVAPVDLSEGGCAILAALHELSLLGEPFDSLTIARKINRPEIVSLFNTHATGAWRSHAVHLADLARRRQLWSAGTELAQAAVDGHEERIEHWKARLTETATPGSTRFKRWNVAELLEADRTFRWTIQGVLVEPTFGMIGGEQKTLKSYLSTFLDLALATGTPFLGHFPVAAARPVVAYVGEGGRIPYTRRLERIAWSLGVDLSDAQMYPCFDIAPVASPRFQAALRADLRDLEPALVHVDPWYAYHGVDSEASNLHHEGALLTSLSGPCVDAGATLLINHHFNQTGTKKGLGRLTMAGGQEWVDSWLLLSHRVDPDVPNGRFKLLLEIGSRQWGGSTWELDLNVGRFDVETGEYDGAITWELRRSNAGSRSAGGAEKILAAITLQPGELTKEEAAKAAGMKLNEARQIVNELDDKGLIQARLVPSVRADGKSQKSWRYFPTSDHETPGTSDDF